MGLVAAIVVPAAVGSAAAEVTPLGTTRMGAELNGAREQAGLAVLERPADLDAVAQRHTDRMAAAGGAPFHSDDHSGGLTGWERVGEIVGRTDVRNPDWPTVLTRAFLESPEHREELLDPRYLELGVGAATAGDAVYVTGVFMRRTAAPPSPPRVFALSSAGGPQVAAAPVTPMTTTARPAPPPPTTAAPVVAVPPVTEAPPSTEPPTPVVQVAAPPPVDLGSDVVTMSSAGPVVAGAGGRITLFVLVVAGCIGLAGFAPQGRRRRAAS